MGNGPAVVMERARTVNAARLSQVAHAAKSYWGYPAQWIELWHNQLTIAPAYVTEHETWMAVVDGEVLGFYALDGGPARLRWAQSRWRLRLTPMPRASTLGWVRKQWARSVT